MSIYLVMAGVIAVLFLISLVLVYRNRAEQATHAAAIQKTVTDAMQATTDHRKRLDNDLEQLHVKHRAETITERAHLADRADFDSDWGGVPVESTGNSAADCSATDAAPSGSTGD